MMCEIVYLIVTSGSPWINIVCPRVAYFHRSEKLSVFRMIVAETLLSRLNWGRVLSILSLPFSAIVQSN
ncbi:unnamed protein product [Hymenolepis diminuta]|uniref:Uncharacterized protein n=1 Tax=Hymenolepis diminuta TaxID=6216 RepID=A0A564YX73_HYMDI|nr:unnamed protein product [Hymenolepis diminuta]